MSNRVEPDDITIYRCDGGHAFFFSYEACPECSGKLSANAEAGTARLISHTMVRVNPTGEPYRLGIAEIDGGVKTLCIVEGEPASEEPVVQLRKRNGLLYATPNDTER